MAGEAAVRGSRLWKTELQALSNELNKEIVVSHFPPGTSKWNKVEHKMFSHITVLLDALWRSVRSLICLGILSAG